MTIYASAKQLLCALQVERATGHGTPEHGRAQRHTDDAAVELAADLLAMDRLVMLLHARMPPAGHKGEA